MKSRLEEVYAGEEANYLLPFIWQRGEDEAVIREEMQRIHDSGIRAVCVEARPHPDFLGETWWRDFDIIMEEARRRKMRVWVLDDDHFPTGHAAGKVVGAPDTLRRVFLQEHHMDVIGPQNNASLLIRPWFKNLFNPTEEKGDVLLAVIAAPREAGSDSLSGEFIDLTGLIQGDLVYWDIPEGCWRIFFIITSQSGGSERHKDYLNPLVPESVKILLDTVYEPFYVRYSKDFGGTFAGFFSDEPGFYNDREAFDFQSKLGKKGVALPWRGDLLAVLEEQGGREFRTHLPLLWHEGGERTAAIRYTYMDVVSRLYGEHFTQQIGDWCRARGVEYIGHVLEDNGVHTRLGCGAGHFFRALWGQDMSGLDIVLWQVVPGFDSGPFTNVSGDADGEFYHYGLAKLGSSLGHIDPKKHGRTMCELFGAYGWREGLKLMKWMTDHLLVRGVNYFVPHAFSQAEFPDPDCPPHFYARGKNPQYRYYRELNHYTNRISHLLSGGVHIAPAAVLYHAEADWVGSAMPFHQPVKALMQRQIDCDVLPADVLASAAVADGKLRLGDERYQVLVIPHSPILPDGLLRRLVALADLGLRQIFINGLPERTCESGAPNEWIEKLAHHPNIQAAALSDLAQAAARLGCREIETAEAQPYLRSYHIRHEGLDVTLLTNEHPYQAVKTTLTLPGSAPMLVYDAFHNLIARLDGQETGGRFAFPLRLSPYESLVVMSGAACSRLAASASQTYTPGIPDGLQETAVTGPWRLGTATAEAYPQFQPYREAADLIDLSQPDALPAFSGTIRYETTFDLDPSQGPVFLDLGEVYETAEVWVNQGHAGVRICPPYQFDISAWTRAGQNRLVIEVTNTLVKEQRDFLSRYSHQEPSGLLGPVRLWME